LRNACFVYAQFTHHFPPYHIEAAQTPVCVVSVFLRAFLYGQIRPFYGIFRHFAIQKTPFFECFLPKNGAFFKN